MLLFVLFLASTCIMIIVYCLSLFSLLFSIIMNLMSHQTHYFKIAMYSIIKLSWCI